MTLDFRWSTEVRGSLANAIVALVRRELPPAQAAFDPQREVRLLTGISDLLLRAEARMQGAETREVTILLADLRGFTALTERYPAPVVVDLLNRYLAKMTEVVVRYGGMIDKFMGDSVMALFGAPEGRVDDLQRALACAIEMQLAMDGINAENRALGMPELFMGIGLNTGQVAAGDLGSRLHSEYTVIGDEVNLAARIEAHSLRGQILISASTRRRAGDLIEVDEPRQVVVKGKREPVVLYELLATRRPRLEVPRRELRKAPRVPVDMPFEFYRVAGKSVLPGTHAGRVVDLSYCGLRARIPLCLEPFAQVRIDVAHSLLGHEASTIYAQLLRCEPGPVDGFEGTFEFTAIDPPAQQAVNALVDGYVQSR